VIRTDTLPTIPARRLHLRWLDERDVPALFAIFSHPEVMRYWSRLPMTELSEARELLEEIRECFDRRSLFQWGVALSDGDRVVGTCTLSHVDERNRRAEIGYALARERWGEGLMTEALTALLDFAFGELRLHRIEADVDPANAASLGLLEKLGFAREGYLRERWLVGEGAQDSVLLGLLGRDWDARRAEK
jgi:RimJ/RimL family protein N-acetyltransferase